MSLIRIRELYVDGIKFNNNKDGKGKSEVLGLYLACWKRLRGIILEVVKVMEIEKQLRKLYKNRRKQIQLIKHILMADSTKPVDFGVFDCCIPEQSNQIDTIHLLKLNTLTPKVYHEPPLC